MRPQGAWGIAISGCKKERRRRAARTAFAVVLLLACLVPTELQAQTEQVEYYALDAIGSVRVVFDANAAVIGRMDYAPFGEELFNGLFVPDQRFAEFARDGEAGLDYARARMYQPRSGRFQAPDDIYAGLLEPQRWNRYAYVLNNPNVFTDASGLDPLSTLCVYCHVVPRFSESTQVAANPALSGFFPGAGLGEGAYEIDTLGISLEAELVAGLIPGIGEMQDLGVILSPSSDITDRAAGIISLGVNLLTGGTAPNFGRASRLLNPPINITAKGLNHTLQRHTMPTAANYGKGVKSVFNPNKNIADLIASSTHQPMVRQPNGLDARVFDTGRIIGIDADTDTPRTLKNGCIRSFCSCSTSNDKACEEYGNRSRVAE